MMLSRQDIYLHIFLLSSLRKCSAVTVTVDDVDVAEGSEARITCNIVPASSGADPTVRWSNVTNGVTDTIATYQGGFGVIEPGYSDRFSVENDITLVIDNTLRSDSGTYECSVTLVGDIPADDNDICTLTVHYLDKPVIIFTTLVTEGDKVVMTCVVDSSPEAMCNFIKDDDVLPHIGSCTFTIPSVSRTDDGRYECEADNGVGNKQKSDNRNLDVLYKPEVNLNDQIVSPGETFTITSTVTANPSDVTYLWTTDLPGNEDVVKNGPTFTLKVSELEVDGTVYLVNVTIMNIIGTTTDSAKLTISVTSSIRSTVSTNTTILITESCNSIGLTIGILFFGIFIGIVGLYIGQIIHKKIRKKSMSKKQNADKM
ncbi:roundabout homolog 2-like isoform X2 [Antedon mediterranea]|uniref:roundabout homolog 2-like isoform X2 n=1 Tax=Antedon mediterranea TaxID=105859 RepID=UPI003AF79C00